MARRDSNWRQKPRGQVPRPHRASAAPVERRVAEVPHGDPMLHVPLPHVARVPPQHAVSTPPNPRKPKLVRDVGGGSLRDLFAMFPDLPRPPRPAARLPLRMRRGRR